MASLRSTSTILFPAIMLLAGLGLWWVNFDGRGLFLDEANLALAMGQSSFADLWRPLPYEQYAPPLYLTFVKFLAESWGYDEAVLRLPSLLGAIIGLLGLYYAGRSLQLGTWRWLPLALLFVAPICLRYTGEFKPYMLDLGLAVAALAWAIRQPKPKWYWAPLGAVLIWLSMPMVFCLCSVGLYLLYPQASNRRTWLFILGCWALSFLAFYYVLLAGESNRSNLQSFHAEYFFPLRFWSWSAWEQAATLLHAQLKHAFGFIVLAQVWAALGLLMAGWQARRSSANTALFLLLLSPWLLAVIASSLGKYSLIPRLMLFSFPGWWLLAVWGWKSHFEKTAGLWRWVGPAGVLILLMATNVFRHYQSPLQVGQVRELMQALPSDRPVYVNKWAVPAVRYYRELHQPPLGSEDVYILDSLNHGLSLLPPGNKLSLVYSMETIGEVVEQRRKDSLLLSDGGYSVSYHPFYRASLLIATSREDEEVIPN